MKKGYFVRIVLFIASIILASVGSYNWGYILGQTDALKGNQHFKIDTVKNKIVMFRTIY